MKISVVSTVLDPGDGILDFLASMRAQTRAPDEIVIVDGGSTDGTVARLRDAADVTLVEAPGANISQGRNLAIAHATHDVIAVTDADCAYVPAWLGSLATTIEAGADVAMGWTEPVIGSFTEACLASVNLPLDAGAIDPDRYMPSSRSVAFRRDVLDAVGGYPEWLRIGEDMWLNHRLRERRFDLRFAPEAVARWRLRPSLGATFTQYLRYARGDAHAGMYPERHALRFAVYAGLALALRSGAAWPKALALAGGLAYARMPVRRAWARLTTTRERLLAVPVVPALMALVDVAKMAGYVAGLADRATGRVRPGDPPSPTPPGEHRARDQS